MIPKIIHYAWFGGELPEKVVRRVERWKEVLPDWEFKFWNDSNWDYTKYEFSKKMYEEKKFVFVTDVLRFDVLSKYGGVYLDTDLEINADLSEFLNYKLVLGYLYDNSLETHAIFAEPNSLFMNSLADLYKGRAYEDIYNDLEKYASNPIATAIFSFLYPSFSNNGKTQLIEGNIKIFSKGYFSYKYKNKTNNYIEHLFDKSWGTKNKNKMSLILKSFLKKYFPNIWISISNKRGLKNVQRDLDKLLTQNVR